MRRGLRARQVTAAVAGLALVAGCGGGNDASPETFFEDVEAAVNDFAGDLDDVDAEFRDRSWDAPDDPDDVAEFIWRTDLDIQEEYLDVWRDYVDRLESLQPPEGYPEAGEDYAEGLPEYFEEAIIETEQAALAAMDARWEMWSSVSNASLALAGSRELPADERQRLDDASETFRDALSTLEDEWEWFEDSADAVGHPIDDAVELRTDFELDFLPLRSGQLAIDISREAAGL